MSTNNINAQEQPFLTVLQGGNEDNNLKDNDPRRVHARDFLPRLALGVTVFSLAGATVFGGVIKAGEGLFGLNGSSRAVLSVRALKDLPRYRDVTPITTEAAAAGSSAMGGLINPQVYKTSSTQPGTEASNLDTAIGEQGPDILGATFKVPVIDPTEDTAAQIKSPDFVVGPVEQK